MTRLTVDNVAVIWTNETSSFWKQVFRASITSEYGEKQSVSVKEVVMTNKSEIANGVRDVSRDVIIGSTVEVALDLVRDVS